MTRRLRLDAEGGFVHYEDGNDGVRASGAVTYKILHYPRVLKIVYAADYWDLARQGRIYFSPEHYLQHGPSLHWRHYVDPHRYHGGKERYYGIKIPLKVDSDGEFYGGFGLEFLWDITLQCQVGANFDATFSDPYDGYFGRAWFRFRF